jgi:hypothetical protein
MWQWVGEHWEFIFGVLGVIGVVVSTIAWVQQRQPKQLDYEIRSDIRLMNPRARDLQLRVTNMNGLGFEDPRIMTLRIRNTGKKAVSEEDFIGGQPIIIVSEEPPTPTVEAQLTDRSPGLPDDIAEVTVDLDQEMDSPDFGIIRIEPKLLNSGEWFDVQILFENSPGDVSVTARFADQRRPMKPLDSNGHNRMYTLMWGISATCFALGYFAAWAWFGSETKLSGFYIRLIPIAVGAVLLFFMWKFVRRFA